MFLSNAISAKAVPATMCHVASSPPIQRAVSAPATTAVTPPTVTTNRTLGDTLTHIPTEYLVKAPPPAADNEFGPSAA